MHTIKKTKIILNNAPLGTGKTTILCEIIREDNLRAIILSPTHELATQIEKKFDSDVIHIYGRDAMVKEKLLDCPHLDQIRECAAQGRSGSARYCHGNLGECERKHECPYLIQQQTAISKQVVIMTHDQILNLAQEKWEKLIEGRDLMVVDENFLSKYRQEHVITHRQIIALRDALKAVGEGEGIRYGWVEPLLRYWRSKSAEPLVLPDSNHPMPKFMHNVDQYFAEHSPKVLNILGILMKAARQGTSFRFRQHIREGQNDLHDVMTVVITGFLPTNIPIFVLDSTSQVNHYQLALGEGFDVVGIRPHEDCSLGRNARVIQCVSGGYSNATLIKDGKLTGSGRRMFEIIESKIEQGKSHGIIATLKFEKLLKENGLESQYRHFNFLRGMDDYKDVDQLFIVGYQMHSFTDIARKARIIFAQEWDDDAEASKMQEQKDYVGIQHWMDDLRCKVFTHDFQNPFIRAYYQMFIVGEIEQAIGRARMFLPSSNGRQRVIYLLTNIPTSAEVDEIIMLSEPERPAQLTKIINAGAELISNQGEFTMQELIRASGVNKTYVYEHMVEVCISLGLEETTLAHNKKVYCPLACERVA